MGICRLLVAAGSDAQHEVLVPHTGEMLTATDIALMQVSTHDSGSTWPTQYNVHLEAVTGTEWSVAILMEFAMQCHVLVSSGDECASSAADFPRGRGP